MVIPTLKRYVLFSALFAVVGLILFYILMRQALQDARRQSQDEIIVLTVLDNLDRLNSAFFLIEKNEKPFLLNADHTASREIERGYVLADSALRMIKRTGGQPFFSLADISRLHSLVQRKISISKQLVSLSESGKVNEGFAVLKTEHNDEVVEEFIQKYNSLFGQGRNAVLKFQQEHNIKSLQDFRIVQFTSVILICSVIFLVFRSFKSINLQSKLVQQNKMYRDIIENSRSPVTITDEYFKLSYCNNATAGLLGISPYKLPGRHPGDFFKTQPGSPGLDSCIMVAKEKGTWTGELEAMDASGRKVYLHTAINAMYDDKHNVKGCVAIHSNITQLKAVQDKALLLSKQLQEANDTLAAKVEEQTRFITDVFTRINEDFIGTGTDFIINYINAARLLKGVPVVLYQTNLLQLVTQVAGEETTQVFINAFNTGQPAETEFQRKETGQWFRARIYPSSNGISAFFIDITAGKAVALELERSQMLYRFTSQSNEAILRAQSETEIFAAICHIAHSFKDIILSVVSLYAENEDKIVPIQWAGSQSDYLAYMVNIKPRSKESGNGPIGQVVQTGKYQYSNDILHDEGFKVWRQPALSRGFRSSIALPVKKQGKVYAILSFYAGRPMFFSDEELAMILQVMDNINYALHNFDIEIERQRAETALMKISTAVEQSHSPVIITDLTHRIEYANKAFCVNAGLLAKDIIGKKVFETRVPLLGNTGWPADIYEILAKQNTWKGELHSKGKNNKDAWEVITISVIRDTFGDITHYVAIADDITEKKELEAEQQRLTIDLMQTNRSLKQFSYALSHYIRAPLSNILAFKNLLNEGMPEQEQKQVLAHVVSSAEQIDTVIKDINAVLHRQEATPDKIEQLFFNQIIERVSSNLAYLIEHKQAVIDTDFSQAGSINSIRSYVKSIFINIMLNALHYAKPGQSPHISIRTQHAGNMVMIYIKDHGLGINLSKHKNELFGLYKRFNYSVPGKGLGLFSVKAQVEYLGGTIAVNSVLGEWTEFIISLPDLAETL